MSNDATTQAAFVGLDLGTGSVKALAIDAAGIVLHHTVAAYPTTRPHHGWAEQHPDDWWAAACGALRELLAHPALAPFQIAGLGLSGQMHGATLLDAAGNILRPSLLWSDDRGDVELASLAEVLAPGAILAITGSLPHVSATLAKLLWVRAHERALSDRIAHVLLAKDELRRRLTGVYATDPSDAAGTLLYDLHLGTWSSTILHATGLPATLLPPVVPCAAVTGHVTPEAAAATHLPTGAPVVAGSGDAASAVFGLGLRQHSTAVGALGADEILVSIGTAAQVVARLSQPVTDPVGRVQTLPAAWPAGWQVMGAMLAGGVGLEWLARVLGNLPATSADVAAQPIASLLRTAEATAPGAERLLFLPYLSGERNPHLDPLARGVFVGLTLSHTQAHLARAVVEGVAYALRECLDVLREVGVAPARALFAGGPAAHPLWRRVLADVLALPVATGLTPHGSALGAALLARQGITGLAPAAPLTATMPSATHASSLVLTQPDPRAASLYDACYATFRTLYPALRPAFQSLARWPAS